MFKTKFDKFFLGFNILMIIISLILSTAFISWNIRGETSLLYKAMASSSFAITAIVNLIYACVSHTKKVVSPILLSCALLVCFIADIVLEYDFTTGGIVFGIAHVLFIIAFCFVLKFKLFDFIYGIPGIVVVLLIWLDPIFNFDGNLMIQIFVSVYAILICCMGGKAIANLIRERNYINLLILIASILFMLSDLMLLFDKFANLDKTSLHCHLLYYPSQILTAFIIFLFAAQNKQNQVRR